MRKRFLIYPSFQLGLILANALMMAIALAFIGFQITRAFNGARAEGLAAGLPLTHDYFRFLDMEIHTITSYLVVAFIVCFCFSTIVTLLFSNRLAGPVVRLRNYFRQIANSGHFPKNEVSFRKGDFFSDLPALINAAFYNLKHGHSDRKVHDIKKKAA